MGTRNFHQDLKIGESTFAEVYQGRRGNESFAVKVFKQVLWNTILTTNLHLHEDIYVFLFGYLNYSRSYLLSKLYYLKRHYAHPTW